MKKIEEACCLIARASGCINQYESWDEIWKDMKIRIENQFEDYELEEIEVILNDLSLNDFEEICIGECDAINVSLGAHARTGINTNKLLNFVFDHL